MEAENASLRQELADWAKATDFYSFEARLSAVFLQAAIRFSEIGLDGRFLTVNDELCRILGRSREDIHAFGMPDVTYPDDLAVSLSLFERVVAMDDGLARQALCALGGNTSLGIERPDPAG